MKSPKHKVHPESFLKTKGGTKRCKSPTRNRWSIPKRTLLQTCCNPFSYPRVTYCGRRAKTQQLFTIRYSPFTIHYF